MLDAFITKGARRVLEKASDEHPNNMTEDAITSMVFTPLKFMSPDQALACFGAFLPNLKEWLSGDAVLSHEVFLWPRYEIGASWCAPDLVASFNFAKSGPIVLVGEMKWESPIKREQIDKERKASASEFSDTRIFVFAITKNPLNKAAGTLGCDTSPITWTDVHRALARFAANDEKNASTRWASLVAQFLERAEQLIFAGFELKPELGFHFDNLPSLDKAVVFFERMRRFNGFKLDSDLLPRLGAKAVFFERGGS